MRDFNNTAAQAKRHPHPFGLSNEGQLAYALDTHFDHHYNQDPNDAAFKKKIRTWLIENHTDLSVLSEHTPILPLLLCRAYAVVDELNIAKDFYQLCLNKDTVWKNFDEGNQTIQNLAKKHAIRLISDKLSLTPREIMTLQEKRLFDGGDSYAINDIVHMGLHNGLADYAWDIAKKAYNVFTDNIYVATNTLRVVPQSEKKAWLEHLCWNFPNHHQLQTDLDRVISQENSRNRPRHLKQRGWQ